MSSSKNSQFSPKVKHFIKPEKANHHAEMLANRIRKRYAHLNKRFKRQSIDCFRLYDWDIAEIRAVVDWYAGHVVVGEYVRQQTGPEWLPLMAKSVAEVLGVSSDCTHIKQRRTGSGQGPRYLKRKIRGKRFVVRERELKFWVNLDDYLDTGLFSDHRNTRVIIKKLAKNKDFLNLFGYTGAFTCAAAAGSPRSTVTVDRSETYLNWSKDNLKLNNLWSSKHIFIKSDIDSFLSKAVAQKKRYTLAFVDPPSFFQNRKTGKSFDINKTHPELIRNVLKVMAPGSEIFFSTNHQRFEPRLDNLPIKNLEEMTPATIPEDYRNRKIHRCWRFKAV